MQAPFQTACTGSELSGLNKLLLGHELSLGNEPSLGDKLLLGNWGLDLHGSAGNSLAEVVQASSGPTSGSGRGKLLGGNGELLGGSKLLWGHSNCGSNSGS